MHTRRRAVWWGMGLLCVIALIALGYAPFLRGIAAFLVTEDHLEPAAAIIVLGGHLPFREMEAADLYRSGWAPRLVLVRGPWQEEQQALRTLGFHVTEGWEQSYTILLKLGVPPSAIVVPEGQAEGTLEELQIAARALELDGARVILVTSKVHTRRVRLTWDYVARGRSRGIVRLARQDPFDLGHWWRERRFALAVVREYLGLMNYFGGFPVVARAVNEH